MRHTAEVQLESCFVCGRLRPNDEMILSDVEGTRGLLACLDHNIFVTNPSFNDLNVVSSSVPIYLQPPVREQPVGADLSLTPYVNPYP